MRDRSPRLSAIRLAVLLALCILSGLALAQQEGGDVGQKRDNTPANDRAPDIREAYQREYAFLTAQRRELQERIEAFRAEAEGDRERLSSAIDALQSEVIELESRASTLQNRIDEAERQAESAGQQEDILASTFQQADATFSEHEEVVDPVTASGPLDERLASVFEKGRTLLDELNGVRTEEGSFFTRDGDEVNGRLMHLGGVASFGISEDVAGILVPAGSGELKLWRDPRPESARSLADGEIPTSLPLYVYGSLSEQVDAKGEDGVIATIQKGGLIAWLIMALAGLALVLILARIVFLRRASTSTNEMVVTVGDLVTRHRIDEAIEACRQASGSTAAVIGAALRNIGRDRESLDDIINEAILHESSHLERFGSFILVIAAVSPLLGLLGTVTGMISTFEVITEHGTGDPQLLSGGISVALITTELGLIVAIPTLLIGNVLSGWAERIKDDMQKAALRITNLYEESRPSKNA